MDAIFHEKQEGSLCAQHCLNALLQGAYFTPIDLAEMAQTLDESERQHMAEAGYSSQEYQHFLSQPSSNYDDSGFFSIQVLQKAVSVWGLELEPFSSSRRECITIKEDPKLGQAFVCNFREHWLTIRRIGQQWFNLNSLLSGPELVSDTYLSLFLRQLQLEGYSIFIVLGELPPCEADELLALMPAVQTVKPTLLADAKSAKNSASSGRNRLSSSDDPELLRALEESKRLDEDQDEALKKALELSMLGFEHSPVQPGTSVPHDDEPCTASGSEDRPAVSPDVEELRKKRLAFLEKNTTERSQNAAGLNSESSTDEFTKDSQQKEPSSKT